MSLDIRYVAGVFDGEGWITVCRTKLGGYRQYSADYVRYQLVVGVGNTHRPLVDRLHAQFGGSYSVSHVAKRKMPLARTNYTWTLASQPAADFLSYILPHMLVKAEEAALAVEFQKHIRAHTHDFRYRPEMRPALYQQREEFRRKILALKKRVFDSPVVGDPSVIAA